MKIGYWILILILLITVPVLLYIWLGLNWFQANPVRNPVPDLDKEDVVQTMIESDEEIMLHAVDTMVAVERYGLDKGSLPETVSAVVPEYLEEEYADVNYEKISDTEALVTVKLGDQGREFMADDDGVDDELYELTVEI